MKFSLNLAQEFSNVDLKSLPKDQIISSMGTQLGSIEDFEHWVDKYHGVLVVKVVSCIKHPNADNLSVCMIDDNGIADNVQRNDDGLVQVVCGAKNVREGIMVAWIPPGVTVPSTQNKDPFILSTREIRGENSNGMLASPKELEISDNHEGILELSSDEVGRELIIGEPLCDLFGLDDLIVTCENKMFTHRPDCFGNLGIARELAGIFGQKFISPDWYLSDDISKPVPNEENIKLNIDNKIPELSPRFTVVLMSGVNVRQSPVWLQSLLKRIGIKSINNVVDVTNYIMHLTGQPIHAFDLDKLLKDNQSIDFGPRYAVEGEKIKLLGDKEIKLNNNDLVISCNGSAVALAGVMGGADTEVDKKTRRILIECANFDMYSVRRTSMNHGLFTDAVTRFNKGQSPLQNLKVLNYTIKVMSQISDAVQISEIYDDYNFDVNGDNLNKVSVDIDFINKRLGSSLDIHTVKTILENVEFKVDTEDKVLKITAPFWRMDISIAEDVVEEVGRLYGYAKIQPVMPIRTSKPASVNEMLEFKNDLRHRLSKYGANEVLTYSFVHGKTLESCGINPDEWAYHIRNAISPNLQYYRTSLVPSLISKISPNLKAQAGQINNEFAIFEIGKAHLKGQYDKTENNLPEEHHRLGFVYAADDKASGKYYGSAFYQVRNYVDNLTFDQATYIPLDTNDYPLSSPYQIGRSAIVCIGKDKQQIGVIGEFKDSVKKKFKLPDFCAGFEIDVQSLKQFIVIPKYIPISRNPSSYQDITFEVSENVSWIELKNLVMAELEVAKAEYGYIYNLSPLDIFQSEKTDKRRISFRIGFSHDHKTLVVEEINNLLEKISKATNEKFEAVRI